TSSAWSGLRMIESTAKPAAPSVPAASRPTLPWPPIRATRLDSDIGVLLAKGQTAPRGVKAPCPVGRLASAIFISREATGTILPMHLRPSHAVKIGLSIAMATGLYGLSFGALSVASGLDVWQTMALSLLMFTGGSQFAFIGV